jgi:hypothetical protein
MMVDFRVMPLPDIHRIKLVEINQRLNQMVSLFGRKIVSITVRPKLTDHAVMLTVPVLDKRDRLLVLDTVYNLVVYVHDYVCAFKQCKRTIFILFSCESYREIEYMYT